MWIILLLLLIGSSWAAENLTITEPEDGATYNGDWLSVRAIVENDNEPPDSVHHTLNGESFILIPRLNTDCYTYMQDGFHTGFSESPAPGDNSIFWTADITEVFHIFQSVLVVDGIVYYGCPYGDLYAFDAASGAEIWTYPDVGGTDDPPTVVDGLLYIAADSVFCIDAVTGQKIWATDNPGSDGDYGTPVVMDGMVYYGYNVTGTGTCDIRCLDASDGDQIWSSTINGKLRSCATGWNGILLVPVYNGPLYALDTASGDTVWENTDSEGGFWDTSPAVSDGIIYIGGIDARIHAIDAANGTLIWESLPFSAGIEPTPCVTETMVFAGCNVFSGTGDVFAMDRTDGSIIWRIDNNLHGSIAAADGAVFWGGYTAPYDSIYAADALTGMILWTFHPEMDTFLQSTPAITDGVMYFPATGGKLYAFGTGLKYTYLDDLFAQVGANELIVTSFDEGVAVAADTINFTVTGTGTNLEPTYLLGLSTSPNPFTSSLNISYHLSEPTQTELSVYDLSGRVVESLINGSEAEGNHVEAWNPSPAIPDGCYLIVLDACGERAVRRCVLLR